VNVNRRPDAVIATLHQNKYAESKGYGEVKIKEATKDSYCLTRDLIRLGIFSKQAIDHDNMNAMINFQAIGKSLFNFLPSGFNFY
jgi:hypothetical protein